MLCIGVLFAGVSDTSHAFNFTDKIEGRGNVNFVYKLSFNSGALKDNIDYINSLDSSRLLEKRTRNNGHSLLVGLGYNLYFKINDLFNPFIGIEATGKIPVQNSTIASLTTERSSGGGGGSSDGQSYVDRNEYNVYFKMREHFVLHAKLGNKFNVLKNFSISQYYAIGFSISRSLCGETESSVRIINGTIRQVNWESSIITNNKANICISTGVDFDALMFDKFSFSLEYRYVSTKIDSLVASGTKAKTHHLTAKIGYSLL